MTSGSARFLIFTIIATAATSVLIIGGILLDFRFILIGFIVINNFSFFTFLFFDGISKKIGNLV